MGGLACKTKVILDGGVVEAAASKLCYQVEETEYDALTDEQWKDVIKYVNAAEDSMFKAQKTFLEALGYSGPWPKSMT